MLTTKQGLITSEKKKTSCFIQPHNATQTDQKLKRTLELFAANMNEISKRAMGFFDKYATGGSKVEFAKDFGKLFATVTS